MLLGGVQKENITGSISVTSRTLQQEKHGRAQKVLEISNIAETGLAKLSHIKKISEAGCFKMFLIKGGVYLLEVGRAHD